MVTILSATSVKIGWVIIYFTILLHKIQSHWSHYSCHYYPSTVAIATITLTAMADLATFTMISPLFTMVTPMLWLILPLLPWYVAFYATITLRQCPLPWSPVPLQPISPHFLWSHHFLPQPCQCCGRSHHFYHDLWLFRPLLPWILRPPRTFVYYKRIISTSPL